MARYTTSGTKTTIGAINTELEKIATSQEDLLSRIGEAANQMEADFDMNSHRILNLLSPLTSQEAATKGYVDTRFSSGLTTGYVGTPRDFGGQGDGVTDDTLAVQEAFDTLDYCIIDASYAVSDTVTTSKHVTCVNGGEIKYIGVETNPVKTVLAIQAPTFGHLRVNANNKEVKTIFATGDMIGDTLEYYGINASDPTKNVSAGVVIETGHLRVNRAIGYNLTNTGHTNDSFPQSFVVSQVGTQATIGSHTLTDSRSGLVTSGGGKILCENSRSVNCDDNGAYCLSNSIIYIGTLYYEGNEEPLVNLGTAIVNELIAVGSCFSTVRVQNADSTYIGTITGKATEGTAEADLYANVPTGVYEHRSGNTASGECYIGRVQGMFYLSVIRAGFSSGTTSNLTIGSMDVDLILRDETLDVNWNKQNWFNLNDCLSFDLKDITVNILDIDDSLTTSVDDYLYSDYPTAVSLPSSVENFDVFIRAADGSKSVNGVFRGGAQQANLRIQGGKWQTNVGPWMREADFSGAGRDSVTQVPTTGYWFRDQVFTQGAPDANSTWFYRCIASGTAGTWETLSPSPFLGLVTAAGSATSLPSGWSSASTVTGQFTITHNLGTTSYVVIPTVETNSARFASVLRSSNSFTVYIYNDAAIAANDGLAFTLSLI